MTTVERKYLLARLVEGEPIVSRRRVPFPHRFFLNDVDELESFVVERLTELRLIAGKPDDALWDHITYRVADVPALEREAWCYWPRGFGHCATCDVILGAGAGGKASRHGADKAHNIEPCEGSGKPLTGLRAPKPDPLAEAPDAAA